MPSVDQSLALTFVALVSSIILFSHQRHLWSILALLVCGLEVTTYLGWVKFGIAGVNLPLVMGGLLTVVGVLIYLRVTTKLLVTCATLVTFVGMMQTARALGII